MDDSHRGQGHDWPPLVRTRSIVSSAGENDLAGAVPLLEDDHGCVGCTRCGVGVEVLVNLGPHLPETIAFFALDPSSAHRMFGLALGMTPHES